MFDVSFIELMVIGVVALIVLGPEKLPVAARTVGRFVRKARSSWNSVRSEFEREFAAEELKRSMRETQRQFDEAARSMDVSSDLRKAADEIRDSVVGHPAALGAPLPETPNDAAPSMPIPADDAAPSVTVTPGVQVTLGLSKDAEEPKP